MGRCKGVAAFIVHRAPLAKGCRVSCCPQKLHKCSQIGRGHACSGGKTRSLLTPQRVLARCMLANVGCCVRHIDPQPAARGIQCTTTCRITGDHGPLCCKPLWSISVHSRKDETLCGLGVFGVFGEAIAGGCQNGWGQLLSVLNAVGACGGQANGCAGWRGAFPRPFFQAQEGAALRVVLHQQSV
jgi:hypothetical protein